MHRIALGFVIASSLSTSAAAEKFTAADVLAWQQDSQDSFFEASVSMAGVIAVQGQNPAGACINDWYFKTDDATRQANDEIRRVMQKYADHYPGTVIVAVIEKNCGDLTPD